MAEQRFVIKPIPGNDWCVRILDRKFDSTMDACPKPQEAVEHVARMNSEPDAEYCSSCLVKLEEVKYRHKWKYQKYYHPFCSYCYMSQFD